MSESRSFNRLHEGIQRWVWSQQQKGKPLPEKYWFLLFEVGLVRNGKREGNLK